MLSDLNGSTNSDGVKCLQMEKTVGETNIYLEYENKKLVINKIWSSEKKYIIFSCTLFIF